MGQKLDKKYEEKMRLILLNVFIFIISGKLLKVLFIHLLLYFHRSAKLDKKCTNPVLTLRKLYVIDCNHLEKERMKF